VHPDLLQISLGTTRGLRIADGWFAQLAGQAGVTVETVGVRVGETRRLRRAYPVTDVVEALAARRASGILEIDGDPSGTVYFDQGQITCARDKEVVDRQRWALVKDTRST